MSGIVSQKLALVTGAGSGIGRAACKSLAREGATIIAADIKQTAAQETIRSITQNKHLAIELDVRQSSSIKQALAAILKTYQKPPCIVVNCAGITRDNFLVKMAEEDFQDVIDVNLKGTFLVMQTFAKSIAEAQVPNASIINIGSIVGKFGNMGQANYTASKAAVESLTKTATKELAQYGIRCNTVVPGFIKSPMTDLVPDKVKLKLKNLIASGRMGEPEEVAEVIVFLASERSSYVNGTSIEVTGGFL